MLSDEDLKAAGQPGKPSLWSRLWNRPVTRLAIMASAVVILVLVIALPAALVGKGDGSDDSNSGSSSGSSGSGSGTSTSSSSGSKPTKMPGAGCGNAHAAGYSFDAADHHVTATNTQRNFTIDVPANYNDANDSPWPMILDFHGASRDAANQYNNSQYFEDPRGDDYIIVYPQGMGNKWESASYASKKADDIDFINELLKHMDDNYCVDQERIYASGKSNGAGFVDYLACSDTGDQFAAFGLAAAALYGDLEYKPPGGCDKKRAILEVHGGKDDTVPYTGQKSGIGGESPDVLEWLGWWARRDGCKKSDEPTVDDSHDDYNVTTYSCGGYDDILKQIYIPDLNHCWPSATGNNSDANARPKGCGFRDLDFTSTVLDWFETWNMTNVPSN
ncbi:hypothetical protein Q7P37_005719 [Cladosporium fusiforme]